MSIIKKSVAIVLAALLLLSVVACVDGADENESEAQSESDFESVSESGSEKETSKKHETQKETESETEKETLVMGEGKSIDIYLIAGQSNAAGCTKITNFNAAYEWAPELKEGYSNIHYAGNSRNNSDAAVRDTDRPWQKTTLGLGIYLGNSNRYVGPEAGMAKALSVYYNEETGKEAGFIKYAYGGSSLFDDTAGSTAKDGNWVSPSYSRYLGKFNYGSSVTGQMYRNFLEQVERNLLELYEYGGYTEINIKGLYWMQGCANKGNPREYKIAFEYFCTDIRADLSSLALRLTGGESDLGAANVPIIVGTLSQTQNLTSASTESVNIAFIEMQKKLPETIENCYVVDNSQYPITRWNSTTNRAEIVGSDQWHWNQADALTIGENVGKLILDEILNTEVADAESEATVE